MYYETITSHVLPQKNTTFTEHFFHNIGVKLFLGRLHLAIAGLWFLITFLILLPFFWICIQLDWRRGIVAVNWVWCLLFFYGILMPVRKRGYTKRIQGPAVVVANHGSYFDIPVLTDVFPQDHAFMGKSSLGRIPLFGWMYRNLHILVDRGDRLSKKRSLRRAHGALKAGKLLIMFPEGTIRSEIQPGISPFKDGAFYLAIHMQVPLIPVTLPYDWKILPDDGRFSASYIRPLAVIHEPISTIGLTDEDVPALKERIATIFAEDLKAYNGRVYERNRGNG